MRETIGTLETTGGTLATTDGTGRTSGLRRGSGPGPVGAPESGASGLGRIGALGGLLRGRAPELELPAPERTVSRCLVCGSREVRTDEVEAGDSRAHRPAHRPAHRGWVLLAECRHCDHRWTRPLPDEAAPRRVAARSRSVRPAREAAEGAPAPTDAEVASAA